MGVMNGKMVYVLYIGQLKKVALKNNNPNRRNREYQKAPFRARSTEKLSKACLITGYHSSLPDVPFDQKSLLM
jgi:hypothetical protein